MLEVLKYLMGAVGESGYGSKSTAEEVTRGCPHLRSVTAIITGATSGIGRETARVLAKRGARIVIPARSLQAADDAKSRILSESPDSDITVMYMDLSSLSSVRAFASEFESLGLSLNLLINNAGRFPHRHSLSDDGLEMTFATNYLGHFLLTKLLLNNMIRSARMMGIEGRIVNVTSSVHGWFVGDIIRDVCLITGCHGSSHYDPTQAYALSKLANVLHTRELAQRLQGLDANVTVNSVHPGVVRTKLTRERDGIVTDLAFFFTSKLVKSVEQAAATTCYVATRPDLQNVSGKYFTDCNKSAPSGMGSDAAEASRLWWASEAMVLAQNPKAVLHSMCGLGS